MAHDGGDAHQDISDLQDAVNHSPDNAPLRMMLGQALMRRARYDEAEREFREVLRLSPRHEKAMLFLARTFFQQGKTSQALVAVENLIKAEVTDAEAYLLHARILYSDGEVARAVTEYKKAVDLDDQVADAEFENRLGIQRPAKSEGWSTGVDEAEALDGRARLSGEAPDSGPNIELEKPDTTFEDVGGMQTLKDEIRMKIVHPLTHPEIYKAYGKSIGGGILMYGPPGCGKTHLARATAGEVKARFLAVGINDVLDMWIGNSERNLHEIFELARRQKPCVLFFDEVDALGASRSDLRQSAGRNTINQFLAELDGVKASNEGVLILAATNAPWHLDSAFRRPGRFDRILFVPPPDGDARADILRLLCKGKPVEEIDYAHLAKKSDGFSGADLKAVLDRTVEEKLRVAMKEGVPKPIATRDMLAAVKAVRPSTKEWFATARNYALYSNQGGLYDDILKYLKI